MADDILTKPLLQNAELMTLAPRAVVCAPGAWTQVLAQQAQRYTVTITKGNLADPMIIAPDQIGAGGFPTIAATPYPIHLHGAEYPLEITGPWYVKCNAGQTVNVYETLRIMDQ